MKEFVCQWHRVALLMCFWWFLCVGGSEAFSSFRLRHRNSGLICCLCSSLQCCFMITIKRWVDTEAEDNDDEHMRFISCDCGPRCVPSYLDVLLGPFHWVTSAGCLGLLQGPRERRHHCHTDFLYASQLRLLPAGVTVALTWLGNLRVGRGPPGYRGDMNGWKNKYKYMLGTMYIH